MKKIIIYICIVVCSLGCLSDRKPSNKINDVPSEPIINKTKEVRQINLFLENSASMAGYFQKRTSFSDKIDDIITQMNSTDIYKDKLFTYTICDSIENYKDVQSFQEALRLQTGKKISVGKSSKLDNIIQRVYENTNQEEVSLLITDGIMSGSDKAIKAYFSKNNTHYNIDQKNALKNEIFTTVDNHKKEYFVNIYPYKSNFNGTYYSLDNSKTKGEFNERPYYIIAVGQKSVYEDFVNKTHSILNPKEIITLGAEFSSVKCLPTIYGTNKKNVEIKVDSDIIRLKPNRRTFTIPLLVNFESLQKVIDITDVEDIIQVTSNDNELESKIEVYSIDDTTVPLIQSGDSNFKSELSISSHLIEVNINNYDYNASDIISISIKNEEPVWYRKWDISNDLKVDYEFNKTLNLDYFIAGFIEAYNEEYILNQKLNIKG